jgi:hypothetical protein
LTVFKQEHEFLTQQVDGAQFVTGLAYLLNLLPLFGRQFLRWQNHQKGRTARRKATPSRLGERASRTRIAAFLNLAKELQAIMHARCPSLAEVGKIRGYLALLLVILSSALGAFWEARRSDKTPDDLPSRTLLAIKSNG